MTADQLSAVLGRPADVCSPSGMVVCGHPLGALTEAHFLTDDCVMIPVGNIKFQKAFLERRLLVQRRKISRLIALARSAQEHGVHWALHLLRVAVSPSQAHLLRSLSPAMTRDWAASFDTLVPHTWKQITEFHEIPDMAWRAAAQPAAFGGLGMSSLYLEAPPSCTFSRSCVMCTSASG